MVVSSISIEPSISTVPSRVSTIPGSFSSFSVSLESFSSDLPVGAGVVVLPPSLGAGVEGRGGAPFCVVVLLPSLWLEFPSLLESESEDPPESFVP